MELSTDNSSETMDSSSEVISVSSDTSFSFFISIDLTLNTRSYIFVHMNDILFFKLGLPK